jgi:hypothetical protein
LAEIFAFCQRGVLDDGSPAVGIGESSVADGVEDVVAGVDGGDGAIASIFGNLAGAKKSCDLYVSAVSNDA